MIERIVESWLTEATELSFQVPFCHILSSKGFTVLHLTRHCAMELGKDVIALDPAGVPCAFQLKTPPGKRLSMHEWNGGILGQVLKLVSHMLVHPSLPTIRRHHRSFLVTNRGIDEEVMRAIDDLNAAWREGGNPLWKLEVIVGGEIQKDAVALGTNLWPSELTQVRTLLELFLHDGADQLPKEKLADLLETTMGLKEESVAPKVAEAIRSCSSAAVLCALATRTFAQRRNHFAQIESWTMYLALVFSVAERRKIKISRLKGSIGVGLAALRNSLTDLIEELQKRPRIAEGDISLDKSFLQIRATCLLALVAIHVMWCRADGQCDDELEAFGRRFFKEYFDQMLLWGEAATPQMLAACWYYRTCAAANEADSLLAKMIKAISEWNAPTAKQHEAIPSPYYSASDAISRRFGFSEETKDGDFCGTSYSLEALVHLFVRLNWKQTMKVLWPDVTRISFQRFEPLEKWRMFLWRTTRGTHWSVHPKLNKKWQSLRDEASECKGNTIPDSVKKMPHLFLLFLVVYPHRMTTDNVRWLDTSLSPVD